MVWNPSRILRVEEQLPTSCGTYRVITDQGEGYLKAIPKNLSPNVLACELVGTRVASWLGLNTVEHVIFDLDPDLVLFDDPPIRGLAFLSKGIEGHPWGGSEDELSDLENPDHLAGLVVLDTLLRNRDRHFAKDEKESVEDPYKRKLDNVFLAHASKGKLSVIALDQSDCLCASRELHPALNNIQQYKCSRIYGLFPEFRSRVTRPQFRNFLSRLEQLNYSAAEAVTRDIPIEWQVSQDMTKNVAKYLVERSQFLVDHFEQVLVANGVLQGVLKGLS